jgi:hypothetical protein
MIVEEMDKKVMDKSEQKTDILVDNINKDSTKQSNPENKLSSNNSNEKARVSFGEETAELKALRDFYSQTEPIVIVVCSTDTKLYDCHVFKLTSQSVHREIDRSKLQQLSITDDNHIILPKEPGYYLFLTRKEKYHLLRSYIGVIGVSQM